MAHWIPYPDTGSGVDDKETFHMLVQTFAEEFPYVVVQRGVRHVGLHVLGSLEPIDRSPERIRQRLEDKDVAADLREWDPVEASFFESARDYRPVPGAHAVTTDDRPLLEFYLLQTVERKGKKLFAYNFW